MTVQNPAEQPAEAASRPAWAWREEGAGAGVDPGAPAQDGSPADPAAVELVGQAVAGSEQPAPSEDAGVAQTAAPQAAVTVGIDRLGVALDQIVVISLVFAGWVVSFRDAKATIVLPVLAVVLLAASWGPSVGQLLAVPDPERPRLTPGNPDAYRLLARIGGLALVIATCCAAAGSGQAAWGLGWFAAGIGLLELDSASGFSAGLYDMLRRAGWIAA